jgi:hypothetical protein
MEEIAFQSMMPYLCAITDDPLKRISVQQKDSTEHLLQSNLQQCLLHLQQVLLMPVNIAVAYP